MHWIQRHILEQLSFTQELRNSQLRPAQVESNLFQYHLSRVVALGFVEHSGRKYRLAPAGLYWADRYNIDLKGAQPQPKLVSIIGIHNTKGEYLLKPKLLQPFVGKQYVPSGKIRLGELLDEAAKREAKEKFGLDMHNLKQVGTTRITIQAKTHIITDYFGVLYRAPVPSKCVIPSEMLWRSAHLADDETVMPGTQATLQALDGLQYRDITIQWAKS